MSTPFLSDYLPVKTATADVPTNPVTDPGTSPEMIAFCYDAETQTLSFWDPVNETRITVSGASDAEDVTYDNATSGLAATDVQAAIDELDATIDALGTPPASTTDLPEGSNLYFTDERAQDAVGNILVDGTTVNFAYNDGSNQITAEIQNVAVSHFAADVADTDGTLAANSDTRLATQKATKTYVDAHAGAVALIQEVVTTGSQSEVTFSSIAATYRDLELRVRGRGTNASATVKPRIQFNGDTGNNYNNQGQHSAGTGRTDAEALGVAYLELGDIPAASGTSLYSGACIAHIPDYRGTVFNKSFISHDGGSYSNSGGQTLAGKFGGCWRTTATAINAVRVFLNAGNFVDGTVVSLYGRM